MQSATTPLVRKLFYPTDLPELVAVMALFTVHDGQWTLMTLNAFCSCALNL